MPRSQARQRGRPRGEVRAGQAGAQAPIYTWAFKSSRPQVGGRIVNYVTQLNADGKLSCDCPGWRFVKKDRPRGCKHTREVDGEVREILRKYRAGEQLPILDDGATEVPAAQHEQVRPDEPAGSRIRYGRVVEL